MLVRLVISTVTTVLLSAAVLGAMTLSFSPLARTEVGLILTAGVWSLVAGLSLHLVSRKVDRPGSDETASGERLADAR